MQPCDHIGWVYTGRDQFADLACEFLSEGWAFGQKLLYIAEDPEPDGPERLAATLPPGVLEVAAVTDIYGASGVIDAPAQRATFAEALAAALADGFTGICVAADNTPLVTDERRFRAWLGWELVADRFMAANPLTGLCAFDRERVEVDRLRHLATLHPLASSTSRQPQFRMFVDGETLRLEGILDSFAVQMLRRALEETPGYLDVVIDLRASMLMSAATVRGLDNLSRVGVDITIIGTPDATAPLAEALPSGDPALTFLQPSSNGIVGV
jgi:hypothetical protein